MEPPGKILMKHIWRFQQVGGLVSVILVSLNLTIPLWRTYGWILVNLGIPEDLDWLIIVIYFIMVFSIALGFGFLYDKTLKLWKHRTTVEVERNPFQKARINPNEMVSWQYTFIPLLLKNGLIDEAEFNLKWNESNMERDPHLREEVYVIIKWIQKYKLKGVDERWLQDMSVITEKKLLEKYGKIKPDW